MGMDRINMCGVVFIQNGLSLSEKSSKQELYLNEKVLY